MELTKQDLENLIQWYNVAEFESLTGNDDDYLVKRLIEELTKINQHGTNQ